MNEENTSSKPLSRGVLIAAVVALAAVAGGIYYFFYQSQYRTSVGDDVVATVGDETITRHQVEVRERQMVVRGAQGKLSVPEDALFDRAIDTLIDESLIYQDARRKGFSASEEEVEARYNAARDGFDSEKEFLERMKVNLLTPEEFKTNIARQIVLFAYLEDLKRQEVQAQIDAAPKQTTDSGATVTVTAERTPLTQEDINRLVEQQARKLETEFKVEVFLE